MLRPLILNISSAKYIITMIFSDKFFPLHFYIYQYYLWHSLTKKKTLELPTTPEIHSWWFKSLSTSNLLNQHSMLYNSQFHLCVTSYIFSPTIASVPQFFSKQIFFSGHPFLLRFQKKNNTQTTATMSLDSSSTSTGTTMSSDSSSVLSKAKSQII